jgi:hypothetical protein
MMDFKSILNKLDSMDAPVVTPAAPTIAKAVQLNEDAQLRVLSGRTTYVAEAKKKAEEDVKEATKTDKPWTDMSGKKQPGTAVKGDKYTGKEADKEAKAKSKKDESVKEASEAQTAARAKFMDMVKNKKGEKKEEEVEEGAKPDFLDMDKDGDKKEPMKKAVADKKKNPFAKKDESVKESSDMKVGDKKKSSTGGTIEKTKTGVKHTAGKNYSGKAAEADKKKDESKMMPKGKKRPVAESVEPKLTFREMIKLVQESGGQQQIDPVDVALFNWAQRVAASKYTESAKAEIFAGMLYERNGGSFEMYDVLSEDQK